MRSPRTARFVLALFPLLLIAALPFTPEGAARTAAAKPSPLLAAPDGAFYLFYGGERHAVDTATLAALDLDEGAARAVPQRTLDRIPLGAPVPALADGGFISDPDGARYLVFGGLHHIPDDATFAAYGWSGGGGFDAVPVVPVEGALLAALPRGAPVAPAARGADHGRFDWGYCTWWVARRRAVPWLGNAQEWYGNARGLGYAVGQTPLPGAILVRRSASWSGYGHVAYVESVAGANFTVSEMNVRALGELTTRTYNLATDPPPGLIGFIYWRYGAAPDPDDTAEEWLDLSAIPPAAPRIGPC